MGVLCKAGCAWRRSSAKLLYASMLQWLCSSTCLEAFYLRTMLKRMLFKFVPDLQHLKPKSN